MKKIFSIITTILISAVVFVLLSFGVPNIPASAAQTTPSAQPKSNTEPGCSSNRSIQVSGTAVVNVPPDRALIQLGVQSNGATTKQVEELNTTSTQSVIKAVRAMGLDAQDISTDWYIIEPIYDDYSSLYIKGYRINNIVAITVRDVRKASPLIAAALQAGANQVVNVDFYTSELRKYRDQARDMAMKAAQEKAQALARTAGSEMGCVLTITENSWSSYNGWGYGRNQNQNQWTQNAVQNVSPSTGASSSTGDEPISLGKISVRAEINASFGLD